MVGLRVESSESSGFNIVASTRMRPGGLSVYHSTVKFLGTK